MVIIHEGKILFEWKIHHFKNKNKYYKENVKIIICYNVGESKTLEENFAKHWNILFLNLHR